MTEHKYCGLSCGDLMDELEGILNQCIEHSKYDSIFAPKMVQRLIDRCEEVKSELMFRNIQLP